jgi:hypothetical protein
MTPTKNKATPEPGSYGAILVAFAHARRWSPGTVPADRRAGTPWTIGAELLVADLESVREPRFPLAHGLRARSRPPRGALAAKGRRPEGCPSSRATTITSWPGDPSDAG